MIRRWLAIIANWVTMLEEVLRATIMPTRNINLTDKLDRFVATKVKSGRYENASEVVRAGLAFDTEATGNAAMSALLEGPVAAR